MKMSFTLRVKHTGFNPATNNYSYLAFNGGNVFNADAGPLVSEGWLEVGANSVLYNNFEENRSFQLNAWLTSSGNIFYYDANATNGVSDLNDCQCIVNQGALLGSGTNSLETNGLAVAVGTLDNFNSPNASLILGTDGIIFLHRNIHFGSVIINGKPLANGPKLFVALNNLDPTNFPSTWPQQLGSTFNTGSSQIIVGTGGPAPPPHITGITLNGTTLTISATNGTAGGSLNLLQSTNLALPLNWWQTNLAVSFDGSGIVRQPCQRHQSLGV